MLCHAEAWFPVVVLRQVIVKEVVGGLSCCVRILLRRFFADANGFSNAGVPLGLPNGPVVLFAKLTNILGDESALKSIWASKGASGNVPCFLCKHIVAIVPGDFDNSEYLQKLGCRDVSKLGVAISEEVWEKVDPLATDRA